MEKHNIWRNNYEQRRSRGGGGRAKYSDDSALLNRSFVSKNHIRPKELRFFSFSSRLRPNDLLCTRKIELHLSFCSHRQGFVLLPVPSLSRSHSRLFDEASLSAEIAALVRRFLEGSLKSARACKPADDDSKYIMCSSGNQGSYYFQPKRY